MSRDLLNVYQLVNQLSEGFIVELELALEGAERDAPVALQEGPRAFNGLEEAHSSLVRPAPVCPREASRLAALSAERSGVVPFVLCLPQRASGGTAALGLHAIGKPDPCPH